MGCEELESRRGERDMMQMRGREQRKGFRERK
jgi:hypothetical protein